MTGHSVALAVGRTQHLGSKGDYVQNCENSARQEIARGVRRGDDVEGSAREITHGAVGMRKSGGREGESGWFSGVPLGGRVAGQGDGTLYK